MICKLRNWRVVYPGNLANTLFHKWWLFEPWSIIIVADIVNETWVLYEYSLNALTVQRFKVLWNPTVKWFVFITESMVLHRDDLHVSKNFWIHLHRILSCNSIWLYFLWFVWFFFFVLTYFSLLIDDDNESEEDMKTPNNRVANRARPEG